jgi:hypothetical protein
LYKRNFSYFAQQTADRILVLLFSLLCLSLATVAAQAQTISSNFFGMHMHTGILGKQPWPVAKFGSIRLWDTTTGWADINTSPGIYNWTTFDSWLSTAQAHGMASVLYTFGKTPRWASSNPNNSTCDYGPGLCGTPDDLNADGTGTDQHWKDFVRAIATHAAGRVKYWEMWNEPNITTRWTGTMAQLVRMSADARSIILSVDPSAVLLTPAPANGLTGTATWMGQYFAAGGGQYADVIAFHGYVQHAGAHPVPEDVVTLINNLTTVMKTYGQSSKAIWNTEGSWGRTSVTGFTNLDQQSSFLVRYIVLQLSKGVSRFYWYQWNNTNTSGVLWVPTPSISPGTVLKPGIAYEQAYKWLAGATMSTRCSMTSNSTWSCVLTRAGGYEAMIVWNAKGNASFTAASQYKQYRTIYGGLVSLPISGTITVGTTPIMLEN